MVKRELAGDVYYLDSPVHSDYFSLLGPTAVSYGAGVIRLFFEEAEKAKKEYEVKSWWQKLKEGTSGLLASVPGSTFYAGIGTGGFASNNASGNEASVFIVSTFVPALTPASSPVGATEIKEEIAVGLSLGFVIKEEKPSVDLIKEIAPPETKAPSAIIEDTILSQSLLPGLGLLSFLPGMGGSMPPPIPSLSLEPDVAPPETTIVSQPSNPAASTTAVFVFVSSEIDSTFFCQLDGATSTICVSPQEYDNLSEGSHILKVRAIDAVGNEDLTPAEYSWNIDLAPETNIGLSNYSLLNINFTVNWNSFSSDVDYYDVQYRIGEQGIWQDWAMATTTISKSFRAAYDNAIYYFRVRAIDSIGQAGAWQEIQAPVSLKPVIINEIMYDPNPGSDSYYEYVELYNRSPIAIDLAGWQFISGSNLHTISADTIHNGSSTIITPRGFALLTDRVSSPVASSTYDGYYLIPDYSDSTLRLRINDASLDLINTGASLLLENASSAIVDEVSYTSSWGAHNDGKSLERINYNNLYSQNKIAWSQSSSGGTPNAANSSLNLAAGSYIAENTIISSDFIWAKAGSPYLLHSANVNADVILIIEPGTTIRPQSKYVDSLTARGTLKINGTVAEPVLFTSKEAVPRAGDWGTAINFTSNSLNSEIFYTTFEYGGYQNPYPSYYVKPAVVVNGSGVNFNDCIFRDIQNRGLDLIASDSIMSNLQFYRFSSNAAVALYISGESLPVIKNSSFQGSGHSGTAIKINDQAEPQIESNNISGFNTAIWLESAYPNISGNALTDNTKNGIYVSDHTVISKNTVWQNGNVYLLMSNSSQYPTVAASTTLTLEPGVIIKPLNKYYTALKIKGSLVADGNSSSTLINFTSFKDDLLGGDSNNDGNLTNATSTVGDWMNIWFADGSRSTLKFVRFQFGGFHRGIGVEWRVKEDSLKIDAGAQMLMEEISVE